MDVSVTKQLGICIQYFDSSVVVQVKNLKLLETINETVHVLTKVVIFYTSH